MADRDKIVVVTRRTGLEELIERFNSRDQARFYLEHMGLSFEAYQSAHDAYAQALEWLKASLPDGVRAQFIERAFLPNFAFSEDNLVVTLGPDGLVINAAKYLNGQPLLALNPDPARVDGVLIPFPVGAASRLLPRALRDRLPAKQVRMAKAELNDGQTLHAVNDLFIGQRTHTSARYRLRFGDRAEDQSSSGIIVSTGAGSTGWFRSIVTGAAELMGAFAGEGEASQAEAAYRFDWEADYVRFSVREPFISKISSAGLVYGQVEGQDRLEVVSQMPQNGVIFSDGIETDYLEFNSGAIARIGLADRRVNLLVPG